MPRQPGLVSTQVRILVPGLYGTGPQAIPSMTSLCLVINYIIAGAVVIALCVSAVRCLNPPQGRNCVCLVHGQAFWHSTWYTVGAQCRAPCSLRSSLCEIFIYSQILSSYSGPGTVLSAGEAAMSKTDKNPDLVKHTLWREREQQPNEHVIKDMQR